VTFVIGSGIIVALGISPIRSGVRFLGTAIVVCLTVVLIANASFNLAEGVTSSLGRDMTLTDRTFIWADLWAMGTNPVIGVGYDSFWLGARLQRFLSQYRVSTAHNGYLEIYLELGIVGLLLFGCFLLSTFFRAKELLTSSFDYGRLRLAMLAVFLLYNFTESGYKVTTTIFFVLLLVAMNVPVLAKQAVTHSTTSLSGRRFAPRGEAMKPPNRYAAPTGIKAAEWRSAYSAERSHPVRWRAMKERSADRRRS